LLDVTEGVSSC